MTSGRLKALMFLPVLSVAAWGELSVSSPQGEEVWRLDCGTIDVPAFPADTAAHVIDQDGNLWLRDELF